MYRYFFSITLRNLTKRGVFQIINILGLSIGLAVVLLISLLLFNELSFDKAFRESKNIYRMNAYLTKFMPGETFTSTGNAVGPAVQEAIPEVIAAVRTVQDGYDIRINDNPMRIGVIWADADFFRLFDTPFLHGTPEAVMSRPNAIALSEEMAKTLFGNDNAMGKTFSLNDKHLMEVAAVFKDYPKNSSFREHKVIAPFMHSYPGWRHQQIQWGNLDYETFCLLSEKADTASLHAQIRKVLNDATQGMWDEQGYYWPELQRLEDIHLHSAKFIGRSCTSALSDISKVRMLSLLAVIILVVACVNYMNLSTARAQKRSKEIGVNKTLGAKRYELINRLFFETGIFTFASLLLAFVLAWLSLPAFNDLLGEHLNMEQAFQPLFLCIALAIWAVTTVLAASYPALYMSGFPPLLAIRGSSFTAKSSHANVRKALSIGQFAIAIVLIAWVIIIQAQIRFLNNKDLGYNPRNLISIRLFSNPEAMANDFRAESSVEMAARTSNGLFNGSGNVLLKNVDDPMGLSLTTIETDPEFIDVMQMKLIAGRRLPVQQPGDTITSIILNRAAVEYLEMTPEEVIGKRVMAQMAAKNPEVCGVVENFNFESLHTPVRGFAMHNNPRSGKWMLMLRVKEGNLSEQLKTYEQIFKKHAPNENFEPFYPELEVQSAYDGERRTSRIAIVFSILAILVACMGVFGLTAFMAEQRTKEIGIRKVMGATVWNIVSLFTNNYVKLLGIALIIAIPAAWWVGNQYLQNFAYRISLSWWMFVAAALITVALTLLTVSVQALKAAMSNPVKAIKSE